jgi:hypothetical protein
MPTDFDGLKVALYVWNSSNLTWERFQQSRRDTIMQMNLLEQILEELKSINNLIGELNQ